MDKFVIHIRVKYISVRKMFSFQNNIVIKSVSLSERFSPNSTKDFSPEIYSVYILYTEYTVLFFVQIADIPQVPDARIETAPTCALHHYCEIEWLLMKWHTMIMNPISQDDHYSLPCIMRRLHICIFYPGVAISGMALSQQTKKCV